MRASEIESQEITLLWTAHPMLESVNIQKTGVYAWVLQHENVEFNGRTRNQSIYYVGQSTKDSIESRWHDHISKCTTEGTYWYPQSIDDFLTNPVDVINKEDFCYPDGDVKKQACQTTYDELFKYTHFCYACMVGDNIDLIESVEYVLQERVKEFIGIISSGWIGDSRTRTKPTMQLAMKNTFDETAKNILKNTLPITCEYTP